MLFLIYCFNVLHLFKESDRLKFLKNCYEILTDNGFLYFTVFSEREASFGKGKEIETNTFESKVGRPVHYFTEDDLKSHFRDFYILKIGIIEESEDPGELGKQTHILRYIFVKKK